MDTVTFISIPSAKDILTQDQQEMLRTHAELSAAMSLASQPVSLRTLSTYSPESSLEVIRVSKRLVRPKKAWSFWYLGHRFQADTTFIFDGASLPIFLHWWVHPFATWVLEAACAHDLGYRNCNLESYHITVGGVSRPMYRREIDRLFLAALLYHIDRSGKGRRWRARRKRRAHTMYLAVRMFGRWYMGAGDGTPPEIVRRHLCKAAVLNISQQVLQVIYCSMPC